MVGWAKENVNSSGFGEKSIRYIVDDVTKFVQREIRRGNKYDAIIMDPPSYGRGKNGEVWQFESGIADLVELCTGVLSDDPLFFLINSYTTGISSKVLEDILYMKMNKTTGKYESGEIGIPMKDSKLVLPCGIFGRWEK
jgi:23S rRNA (cytosine1962-C5)-methyltransferase